MALRTFDQAGHFDPSVNRRTYAPGGLTSTTPGRHPAQADCAGCGARVSGRSIFCGSCRRQDQELGEAYARELAR